MLLTPWGPAPVDSSSKVKGRLLVIAQRAIRV